MKRNIINIFLTNLGKYNEGELVGEWVELPATSEELEAVKERIGINERYEEWFITDYDTDFDLTIGEYDSVEELNELAEELESLDEYDREVVEAIIEAHGGDLREAIDSKDDYTYYSGYTLEELAQELADEQIACYSHGGEIPEFFTRYFDYEAFERDLGFDFVETSKGCISRY